MRITRKIRQVAVVPEHVENDSKSPFIVRLGNIEKLVEGNFIMGNADGNSKYRAVG